MYKIMIVDDEKAIRESLPLAVDFGKYGYQVCAIAKNGEEALKKWKEYTPDVILLDVSMPVMDGLGFLKYIIEIEKAKLPCTIMLSGYSDFEYARTAMRYGAKAYLTKPLEEEELISILAEVKSELDSELQKQDGEILLNLSGALQKMYHNGDGERENYKDYLLMHCVLLREESLNDVYSIMRECIEERLPGGNAAFLGNKGSVVSYLLNPGNLGEYQYSVSLFARHILYNIKKSGIECALMFDELIFKYGEGTFRSDYDSHLYQMLTEVFWQGSQIIQNQKNIEHVNIEKRLEQEDSQLYKMRKAIEDVNLTYLKETFKEIMNEAERKKLNIVFIQELNYRIYFTLVDILQKEGDESADMILKPMEWRESPYFIGHQEWETKLWAQLNMAFLRVNTLRNSRNSGIADKVISYIQHHFKEQICLKEVADYFFVSPSYLSRCLQKSTGDSFKQYLNELRIEEAKRLLSQTDKLIYEIAEEVGFKESKYFTSKFTADVGVSPIEYRKKRQYLHTEQ